MKIPVDQALAIYSAIADRTESKGIRNRLWKHLMEKIIEGEKDEHRLTVHGLAFLQNVYHELDSRA
jgi:hypothetical protein